MFSIGEMTAHPKYYSFVGLVAPADRKAVYMGYAFLYGVFGSLLGSNLGAFMYARIVEPAIGTAAIMVVHLFGSAADLDGFTALSARRRIPLIEDGSQAHGARWRGRRGHRDRRRCGGKRERTPVRSPAPD